MELDLQRSRFAKCLRSLNQFHVEVADANVFDPAVLDQLIEGAESFFERHKRIGPMDEIQIEIIHLQAAELFSQDRKTFL